MDPNEVVKSEPTLARIPTAGERWKRQAVNVKRRNASTRRWLRTSRKVLAGHRAAANKFAAIEKRVQAERPSTDRSPDPIRDHLADIAGQTAAEADSEDAGLRSDLERSSHFMLDARLKNLLAGILDIRIPAVKIYTNQESDRVAKQHNADAVTYQDKIFFRTNKFNPGEPAGMALLGHELTHVAQERLENQQTKGFAAESRLTAQESEALANEGRILRHASVPATRPGSYLPGRRLFHDPLAQQIQSEVPDGRRGGSHFSEPPAPATGPSLQVDPLTGRQRPGQQPLKIAKSEALHPLQHGGGGPQAGHPPTRQLKAASSSRQISLPPEISAGSVEPQALSEQQLDQAYRYILNLIQQEFERGG